MGIYRESMGGSLGNSRILLENPVQMEDSPARDLWFPEGKSLVIPLIPLVWIRMRKKVRRRSGDVIYGIIRQLELERPHCDVAGMLVIGLMQFSQNGLGWWIIQISPDDLVPCVFSTTNMTNSITHQLLQGVCTNSPNLAHDNQKSTISMNDCPIKTFIARGDCLVPCLITRKYPHSFGWYPKLERNINMSPGINVLRTCQGTPEPSSLWGIEILGTAGTWPITQD